MTLLVDSEISARISQTPPLAQGVDPKDNNKKNSPIQAASLDLTVGEIYVPGTQDEEPGGADSPLSDVILGQGHTAVIRTRETLALHDDLAGIAFPPASLSLKGLLTTNPGHIDPGYSGPLHLTVINMGKAPIALKVGERIMRVLFLTTTKRPCAPYNARNHNSSAGDSNSERSSVKMYERIRRAASAAIAEFKNGTSRRVRTGSEGISSDLLMRRLSNDFLDIERRATNIAKSTVRRAQLWATVIPIVVALVALCGNIWLTRDNGVAPLSERVVRLEAAQVQEGRFRKIEKDIAALKAGQSRGK